MTYDFLSGSFLIPYERWEAHPLTSIDRCLDTSLSHCPFFVPDVAMCVLCVMVSLLPVASPVPWRQSRQSRGHQQWLASPASLWLLGSVNTSHQTIWHHSPSWWSNNYQEHGGVQLHQPSHGARGRRYVSLSLSLSDIRGSSELAEKFSQDKVFRNHWLLLAPIHILSLGAFCITQQDVLM